MQETVVKTGTNVKFIGSTTKMTQANWQDYFKVFKKTGFVGIDSFKVETAVLNYPRIYDGAVMVNGILAKYETDDGFFYSTKPTQSEIDALFCVRVYLQEEKIEIVRKTGLAAGTSYQNCADVIVNLIQNEDAYCTRNDTYFDVAFCYLNYNDDQHNVDCRRFSEDVKAMLYHGFLSGNGSVYFVSAISTTPNFIINGIDPFNPPDEIHFTFAASQNGTYYLQLNQNLLIANRYGNLFTNVEPLVRNALPITYLYTSDFTVSGNGIKNTLNNLTADEPVVYTVRRVDDSAFKFAVTVQD